MLVVSVSYNIPAMSCVACANKLTILYFKKCIRFPVIKITVISWYIYVMRNYSCYIYDCHCNRLIEFY